MNLWTRSCRDAVDIIWVFGHLKCLRLWFGKQDIFYADVVTQYTLHTVTGVMLTEIDRLGRCYGKGSPVKQNIMINLGKTNHSWLTMYVLESILHCVKHGTYGVLS